MIAISEGNSDALPLLYALFLHLFRRLSQVEVPLEGSLGAREDLTEILDLVLHVRQLVVRQAIHLAILASFGILEHFLEFFKFILDQSSIWFLLFFCKL